MNETEQNKLTYHVLLNQVNQILSSMEKDHLSIDELSFKLEESYSLIEKLKSKLFEVETQVNQIINSRNNIHQEHEELPIESQ